MWQRITITMGGSVVYIKSEEQFNEIIGAGKPVVIDFTATWCGPCQRIAPFFEELSTKYPSVTFVKVDVDEMDTISGNCGVRCMPTFLVYKDGKAQADGRLEGASPDALEELVKKFA
ncbi:thioredoxin [Chloropicon primus]|uniref:Thioredoxin n=1 Tax=Chloropicon primus TaxID=1764295 RepID=A0A5B8MYQ1_9CHLO|nr:thioredoxin [Chloropicon primus]|eukprot:QDZ25491.1 thioredoxin [Chloropicon primus]